MEYGLRVPQGKSSKVTLKGVLILVLMEYGLRVGRQTAIEGICNGGLNPCFNGIWSARDIKANDTLSRSWSLNPCFNGIWSASSFVLHLLEESIDKVLILVLMEYGLRGSNL